MGERRTFLVLVLLLAATVFTLVSQVSPVLCEQAVAPWHAAAGTATTGALTYPNLADPQSLRPGKDGTFAQNHQDTWTVAVARRNNWTSGGAYANCVAILALHASPSVSRPPMPTAGGPAEI